MITDKNRHMLNSDFSKMSVILSGWQKIFNTSLDETITKSGFNFDTIELLKYNRDTLSSLLFGNAMNTKKLDYNKDKKIIEMLIMDRSDIVISMRFLKEIIISIDNYIFNIKEEFVNIIDTFRKNNPDIKYNDPTIELLNSIELSIESFVIKSASMRESISHLIHLVRNIKERNIDSVKTILFTPDTLKRYYFKHVYDLKNNVKIFDRDKMMFGEINNIMRMYDEIIDYLFGEFIAMYNTLDTTFR